MTDTCLAFALGSSELLGAIPQEAVSAFHDFQTGKEPSIQGVPRPFRQAVRDLVEAGGYRRLKLGIQSSTLSENPALQKALQETDDHGSTLYNALRRLYPDQLELQNDTLETTYEILHRAQPIDFLTRGTENRRLVEEHMQKVIDISQALFPDDWVKFQRNAVNFISGESTAKTFQGKYRFARLLLNAKSGRPLLDVPSNRERSDIIGFATKWLGLPVSHYLPALYAVRDHLARFTPEVQRALASAHPFVRFHVMEAYFGPFHHRTVSDPDAALKLVRFLGEIGFYRELAFSTYQEGSDHQAVVSLGAIDGVYPEEDDVVMLHTHPWIDPISEWLDVAALSVYEDRFLFSKPDLVYAAQQAEKLFGQSVESPSTPTHFYDPEKRIHHEWLQSYDGASHLEIELGTAGLVTGMRIFYAVRPGQEEVFSELRLRMTEHFLQGNYGDSFRIIAAPSYQSIVDGIPKSLKRGLG